MSMQQHKALWDRFCARYGVLESWVPLFDTAADGTVLTKQIGRTAPRRVLKRSQAMENLVRQECAKLIADWKSRINAYDGLLYIMGVQTGKDVTPLYIGKAETIGKTGGNLSANIKGVERDTSKFARWGDNYAYHIGDLSAVVLPGHAGKHSQKKYRKWAKALFVDTPASALRLKQQVFFWTKAWSASDIGVWEEFGPTRLTFLEYLLIGVASVAFGDMLLNVEGKNRREQD